MQEYLIYRGAQSIGVDLGGYFGGMWQLAARGLESPANLVPLVKEISQVYKSFMSSGSEQRNAKEQLIKAWQGGGNRYVSKVMDVWKAWQNDWEIRDSDDGLKYKTTPREQITGLFAKPLVTTQRQAKIKRMSDLGTGITDMKRAIMLNILHGNMDKAQEKQMIMMDKYGDEYAQEFGKKLQPVTVKDVMAFQKKQETTTTEKVRKSMPGTSVKIPQGIEWKGKKPKPSVLQRVRGY